MSLSGSAAYVFGAYALALLLLGGYILSLVGRRRALERERSALEEAQPAGESS